MKRLLTLSSAIGLSTVLGCHSGGTTSLKLDSEAYLLTNGISLQNCSQYLSYEKGDHLYWVDPDGEDAGVERFKVYCDMENGGYAVFESTSDPAFPHVSLTDATVTFFTDEQVTQINALRNVAEDVQAESDLVVNFNSDTSSGGCGGTPVTAAGEVFAITLPLTAGADTTETTREFSGSADHMEIDFDHSINQFVVTGQSPAAGGCTDPIVDRFGVGDDVWIKKLVLKTTHSSRATSEVSGTYYKILLK